MTIELTANADWSKYKTEINNFIRTNYPTGSSGQIRLNPETLATGHKVLILSGGADTFMEHALKGFLRISKVPVESMNFTVLRQMGNSTRMKDLYCIFYLMQSLAHSLGGNGNGDTITDGDIIGETTFQNLVQNSLPVLTRMSMGSGIDNMDTMRLDHEEAGHLREKVKNDLWSLYNWISRCREKLTELKDNDAAQITTLRNAWTDSHLPRPPVAASSALGDLANRLRDTFASRGERLEDLGGRSSDLANNARNFGNMAAALKKKYGG